MTRRNFVTTALAAAAAAAAATPRRWRLGLNTYCLRFQRWNDRQLIDYCVKQKMDAMFLQDSLDPDVMEPKHWADVRAWVKDDNEQRTHSSLGYLTPIEFAAAARVS